VLNSKKIFIISLPRTGTTSVCAALLQMGKRVAHTAYTHEAFARAEVVADTPVYGDYAKLDLLFPNSGFIYLERDCDAWVRSAQEFMTKLWPKLRQAQSSARAAHSADGPGSLARGIHPQLVRVINEVFSPLGDDTHRDPRHLSTVYQRHLARVQEFFAGREKNLLRVDLSVPESYSALAKFVGLRGNRCGSFLRLNHRGKINDWQKFKHPLKVSSHASGAQRRKFLSYDGCVCSS